jgi:hypothetical protein
MYSHKVGMLLEYSGDILRFKGRMKMVMVITIDADCRRLEPEKWDERR